MVGMVAGKLPVGSVGGVWHFVCHIIVFGHEFFLSPDFGSSAVIIPGVFLPACTLKMYTTHVIVILPAVHQLCVYAI